MDDFRNAGGVDECVRCYPRPRGPETFPGYINLMACIA